MRPEKEECKCEECGTSFPDRRAYNAHRRQEHTEEKLFECDVCGKKSTKMSNLKVHMLTHSGVKRFKCEECGRPFAREPDLRKHMRVHTGEKPFECKECSRRFAQSNSLYGHKCANDATRKRAAAKPKLQRRASRSKTDPTESSSSDDDCLQEREGSPSDQTTAREEPNVTSKQNKKLDVDNSSSDDDLLQHEPAFECEECEVDFGSRRAYNAHMRQEHAEKKVFECDYCTYKCNKSTNLKTHMLVHTGEKPFKCDHCEKRFARKGDLVKHTVIHTEKPYECTHCERRFTQSNALRGHKCSRRKYDRAARDKPKPYGCDVCAYKSSKRCNLQAHMLVHTGEKRFKCRVCGTAFARKGDLKKHMRIHTGEKPYRCDECGRRFATSSTLHSHKCGMDVNVDRRFDQGQISPFGTSSIDDDDVSEELQRAPSDQNSRKRRRMRDMKYFRDTTSRSVSSSPEEKQRQKANPSARTEADRPKNADPPMDLNSYLSSQLAKLENELRGGAGLENRSADDVEGSSDSSTSTSSCESQALSEAFRAMEQPADDFDYGSLML